jgi:hypothetical protein
MLAIVPVWSRKLAGKSTNTRGFGLNFVKLDKVEKNHKYELQKVQTEFPIGNAWFKFCRSIS